ncbi:MCE family protein [Actinomadura sp. GTD37]|uniref:MCE family protein n=1 Tax=Actinomadura sp. GTD37 TaxID=1778030 RepID=UPI0035C1FDDA
MSLRSLLRRPRRGGTAGGPSRRASVRFALFAVLTVALTAYLAVKIMGTDFASSYRLVATFDDVSGLKEGDLVKVRGATVGRVDGIAVTSGRARVTVSVRDGVRLPVDSVAEVRWRDLIGARELYLNPGASGRLLPPGGTVKHTKGTVDLGAVINSLGPLTGSLDPDQLNQILRSFSVALDGNQGDINQIIKNLGLLLDTFGSRGATIDQMLKDYRTVTGAVATRDRQIAEVVDNLSSLTEAFASSGTTLDTALVRMSRFSGRLDQAVGGGARELGQVVTSTKDLLEIARTNMKVLSGVVNGLPASLQALLSVMDGGHFVRSAMVCLSLNELQDPCPFTPVLPFPPAQVPGGGGGGGAPKMTAAQRAEFAKVASLFLLNAANAGGER